MPLFTEFCFKMQWETDASDKKQLIDEKIPGNYLFFNPNFVFIINFIVFDIFRLSCCVQATVSLTLSGSDFKSFKCFSRLNLSCLQTTAFFMLDGWWTCETSVYYTHCLMLDGWERGKAAHGVQRILSRLSLLCHWIGYWLRYLVVWVSSIEILVYRGTMQLTGPSKGRFCACTRKYAGTC